MKIAKTKMTASSGGGHLTNVFVCNCVASTNVVLEAARDSCCSELFVLTCVFHFDLCFFENPNLESDRLRLVVFVVAAEEEADDGDDDEFCLRFMFCGAPADFDDVDGDVVFPPLKKLRN